MSDPFESPPVPPNQPASSSRAEFFPLQRATLSWWTATHLIIATNVAVYIAMGLAGAGWINVGSMTPYMKYGANNGAATTNGEWWRLVTAMFIHYGLIHLALNMWAFLQAGHLLERLLGKYSFFLVYLGAGVIGGFATIIWHGDKIWSAGASGAIFGVYGAIIGYMLRERNGLPQRVYRPILNSTLIFSGYNLFYGFTHPQIDNAAHIGGLISGLILGYVVAPPVELAARQLGMSRRRNWGIVALGLMILIGYFASPRFNYTFEDRLSWDQVSQQLVAEGSTLATTEARAFAAFQKDGDGRALAQWIESTALPFYRGWAERLNQLQLKSSGESAHYRDHLREMLRLKMNSYNELLHGLRRNDPEALRRYAHDQQRIANEELQRP